MVDSAFRILCIRLSYMFMFLISLLEPQKTLAGPGDDPYIWTLCQNEPIRSLPPPYGALSGFSCTPVWNHFVLSYAQDKENVTTIVLSGTYSPQWVGIGISRDGKMHGSSAMVGWISEDGKSGIRQYHLQGKTPSEVIPDKGDLNLTEVSPIVVREKNILHLAFQVKFESRLGYQPLLLAIGDGIPKGIYLTKHISKNSTSIDFASGTAVGSIEHPEDKKRTHGLLGIIGWGLLIPIGAIVPRHFKHRDPFWFHCHSTLNFIGFSIGLVSVSSGLSVVHKAEDDSAEKKMVLVHRDIGITSVILATIQVLTFIVKTNKDAESKSYRFWFVYHRVVGVIIIVASYFNIIFGMRIGKATGIVRTVFGVSIAGFLLIVIILELKTCIVGVPRKVHDEPPVFTPDHDDAPPLPAYKVGLKENGSFKL